MTSLSAVLQELGIQFRRLGLAREDGFCAIESFDGAGAGSLVFVNSLPPERVPRLLECQASVALVPLGAGEGTLESLHSGPGTYFAVEDPRLAVALVAQRVCPDEHDAPPGVHPTAIVAEGADVHPTASIGPFCVVGACSIGESSRVDGHTVITDRVVIGKGVRIREHCHIGGSGFGIVRDDARGRLVRIPHLGRAVIEDDVEIFPFTNVDRGTFGDTRIRRGARLDHYVHVSHNTEVGERAIVTAGTILCGGSSVGPDTWIGVGTLLKEKVHIGERGRTGLGAVVIKPVDPGTLVAGVPARALPAVPSSGPGQPPGG